LQLIVIMFRAILIILNLGFTFGCRSLPPQSSEFHQGTLARGDCLIIVLSSERISAEPNSATVQFTGSIDSTGDITLPLIGKLHVLGLTLNESKILINSAIVPRESEVSVFVTRCEK
jgi:protein involved in polysaccharide export with SLBB domain